jgi:hypothetical protein
LTAIPSREYPSSGRIPFKSNDPLRSTISVNLAGSIVNKKQFKQIFQKDKDVLR